MFFFICYSFITYETHLKFTLKFITAPTPSLIFKFITFGAIRFYSVEKVYKEYYFKIWCLKMNGQKRIGNNHSANEQLKSGSERVQFGGGQAQSSSGQSSSSDMAIQMLLNKNKRKVENKPVDKENKRGKQEKIL